MSVSLITGYSEKVSSSHLTMRMERERVSEKEWERKREMNTMPGAEIDCLAGGKEMKRKRKMEGR